MIPDGYETIVRASRTTGFTPAQIRYRVAQGVVHAWEDPYTHRKYVHLEQLKALLPRPLEFASAPANR